MLEARSMWRLRLCIIPSGLSLSLGSFLLTLEVEIVVSDPFTRQWLAPKPDGLGG